MTTGRSLSIAACATVAAMTGLGLAALAPELRLDDAWRHGLTIAAGVVLMVALPLAVTLGRQHLAGLRLLGSAVKGIAEQSGRVLATTPPRSLDAELRMLWREMAALSQRSSPELQLTERLSAILAAVPIPILVVSRDGLVTLANQPAAELLGAGRLSLGTSVFDAIDRDDFARHLEKAGGDETLRTTFRLAAGDTVAAHCRLLRDGQGMVMALERSSQAGPGLHHALEPHRRGPGAPPLAASPLDALDVVSIDCETTGLNAGLDRMLSFGAVRIQGTRLLRQETIDVLVNPGQAIPARSTAIHGISDAMVANAPPLAQRWSEIEPWLRDCLIVGHNVGFDLTVLENELRRAGIEWRRPASLCTVQLASSLNPALADLNLEALAELHGIAIVGRHTALGDALVTAELYLRLLSLAVADGDRTLADLQARTAKARRVIRQQQAAGW